MSRNNLFILHLCIVTINRNIRLKSSSRFRIQAIFSFYRPVCSNIGRMLHSWYSLQLCYLRRYDEQSLEVHKHIRSKTCHILSKYISTSLTKIFRGLFKISSMNKLQVFWMYIQECGPTCIAPVNIKCVAQISFYIFHLRIDNIWKAPTLFF